MKIQEEICTLCLKKCKNFNAIDGNTKHILDILLPEIDLTVIQEPVICKNCEEMLMKYFDLKATCLHTQKCIVPFLNKEDDIKLDIKDVYLSKDVTGTGVAKDQDICAFCMGLVKNYFAISLDVKDGNVMLEKMINQCLPKLDLDTIKKPIICAACLECLEECFHFVTHCLIVGERIKKYRETDINNKGQIELSSLLELTLRDVMTMEVDCNSININTMKIEEQFCEDRKNLDETEIGDGGDTVKLEQISFDDSEEAIKDDENINKNFMEMKQEVNDEQQSTKKNMCAWAEDSNKFAAIKTEEKNGGENETKLKEENLVEMEDQKFLLNEEIEIKTDDNDFSRFEGDIVLSESEVARLPKRERHPVLNRKRDQLKPCIKTTLTKNHVSKTRIHQCELCSFQTKYKHNLKRHLLKHNKDPLDVTMYTCDTCSFQSRFPSTFKIHLLVHKDLSEVAMYECEVCLYQTKWKDQLKKHLLVHKDPSEVTMYKCSHCSFQTKYKCNSLKQHLLLHKDPSEVTMYKCNACLYQTKRKSNLRKHLLSHQDPSEVTMYKCYSCTYETRYKDVLRRHLQKNKDPSEVTGYKCDSRLFQTKHKDNLLLHKDSSGVTMYKCDACSYQTESKSHLRKHLLIHKDPSEVTMYKCYTCMYETKHKDYLRTHIQNHKGPSEVMMYKCNTCSFHTKHKHNLKRHTLVHKDSLLTRKDPSGVPMYKCDTCLYQTKHKSNLRKHFLTHKNSPEVTMYKCYSCTFETKDKDRLRTHIKTHKKVLQK